MSSRQSEVFAFSKEIPDMNKLINTSKITSSSKQQRFYIKNIAFQRYKNSIGLKKNKVGQYDTFNDNGEISRYRVSNKKLKEYQEEEYRE